MTKTPYQNLLLLFTFLLMAVSGRNFCICRSWFDGSCRLYGIQEIGQTDIAGGSQFGYTLLSVILLSNIFCNYPSTFIFKTGIAAERDLAQACRDHFSPTVNFILWVLCEIAIIACDLAEVIGSAIALNLLFGIPLPVGILITGIDVLLILMLQSKGFRWLESFVAGLIFVILLVFIRNLGKSTRNYAYFKQPTSEEIVLILQCFTSQSEF